MKKAVIGVLAGILLFAGFVYLVNASWTVRRPVTAPYLVSHRGVHQTFDHARIAGAQDCTAVLIYPPEHSYIENTLPSMQAAFAAGAAIVELDVHPTTDGEFVVFHDWTLDCRTEGAGVTRERSMAYIRTLDAGYGYTTDGGRTFPLRGTGVGMIPTLGETLDAFPDQRLLINFKSNDPREAELLSAYLADRGEDLSRLLVYGGASPTARFLELHPDMRGFSRRSLVRCGVRYAVIGWTGLVPGACRDTILLLPTNYAPLFWGWPRRLEQRLAAAGTDVWLIGDLQGGDFSQGVDSAAARDSIPRGFSGGIWTNKVELFADGAGQSR